MHVRKRNLMNTWERRYIKVNYDYEIETSTGVISGVGRCSLDLLEETLHEFLPTDVAKELLADYRKHVKTSDIRPFRYIRMGSTRYTVNLG